MAESNSRQVKLAITEYLSSKNLPPTEEWLRSFMPSIRLHTPILLFRKTALFRSPAQFPFQVLDIEDIGHSRWSQVDSLEAKERGESTKGREIIRAVAEESLNSDQNNASTTSGGPHKLLIQDSQGSKIYAFELQAVSGIGVSQMSIGAKLVLKDVVVARGMLLLEPRGVEVMGGKVEAWDKNWRGERKEVLKRKAGIGIGAG